MRTISALLRALFHATTAIRDAVTRCDEHGPLPPLELTSKCSICGDKPILWLWTERPDGTGRVHYSKCASGCGTIRKTNRNNFDNSEAYSETYAPFRMEGRSRPVEYLRLKRDRSYFGRSQVGKFVRMIFRDPVLEVLAAQANLDSQILDLGCGAGELVMRLERLGFVNAIGVDPYAPIQKNNSIIYRGDLSTVRLTHGENSFDFIIMNHVLEHLEDQEETAAAISALIKPEGTLIIRIPVAGIVLSYYRSRWPQFDRDHHLVFHTPQSIRALMTTHGTFELIDKTFDSNSFQFPKASNTNSLRRLIAAPARFTVPFILNVLGQGDQACFVFKPQVTSLLNVDVN